MSIKHKAKMVWYVFRSAVTGRYVSPEEARRHADTTVREKRGR